MTGKGSARNSKVLQPKLAILSRSQRLFWPELDATPESFRLAGGTALALQLGHRTSVDFDFFAFEAIAPQRLLASVPYLSGAMPTQIDENTLSVSLVREGPVKVSFFGLPRLRPIAPPVKIKGSKVRLSNLIEIAAFKAAVVPQRIEVKDYLDIGALLAKTDIELIDMLAAAAKLYGSQYNPVLTLQALSDLDDPALATLGNATKSALRKALAGVNPVSLLAAMRKTNIKPR